MRTVPYDPRRVSLYFPERGTTAFARGHAYTHVQIACEASRLAYLRFETSEAQRCRLRESLRRVGFPGVHCFAHDATGSEAFAARRPSDGLTIVAFRGTHVDRLHDLLTNSRSTMARWQLGSGYVHSGFGRAAIGIFPAVQEWLVAHNAATDPLVVTGHSLGGALATLLISVLQRGRLVTLGAPRVGDVKFAQSMRSIRSTRLVNCCDVVALLPPKSLGFSHGMPMTYIDRNGNLAHGVARPALIKDRANARVDFVRSCLGYRNVLLREFADHSPINYVNALFCTESASVDMG